MDSLTFESIKRDQFDLKKGMTILYCPWWPFLSHIPHITPRFLFRRCQFVVFVVANHEKELEV